MDTGFIDLIFSFITLYIFIKSCSYGLYEIKSENNLFGGICTIGFSLVSAVISNIVVWLN